MGLELLARPGWGPRHKQKHRFLGLVHVLSSSTLSTVCQRLHQKHLKQTISLKLFPKFHRVGIQPGQAAGELQGLGPSKVHILREG